MKKPAILLAGSMLILLAALNGCKKEELPPLEPQYMHQADTIYPLNYYPVYPGSWWTYEVSNHRTIISSVNPEYQILMYDTIPDGSDFVVRDVYVPQLQPENYLVEGYSIHRGNTIGKVVSDTIGQEFLYKSFSFPSPYPTGSFFYNWYRTVVDTGLTYTVNSIRYSHVIRIYGRRVVYDPWVSRTDYFYAYYAKDIGLIEYLPPPDINAYSASYMPVNEDTMRLINYFINH